VRDHSRAIEWLEKAIVVEGATPNAETYYLLAQMTFISGNAAGVTAVADRLVRALPPDPDARGAAARDFARPAVEIFKSHMFTPALVYMKAAARIAPGDATIREILAEWTQAQEASDQYDLMAKDPVVVPPIRFWIAMLSDEARNLELEEPRDKLIEKINEAIRTYDDSEIVAAARQVRLKYPALYRLSPAELDMFEKPKATPAVSSTVLGATMGHVAKLFSWLTS
jgi:hypothetical protein